jgi:hypothetical protein
MKGSRERCNICAQPFADIRLSITKRESGDILGAFQHRLLIRLSIQLPVIYATLSCASKMLHISASVPTRWICGAKLSVQCKPQKLARNPTHLL